MAAHEPIDLVFWGNVLAGIGLILYAMLLWMQVRMGYVLSPRIIKIIRWICLFLFAMPIVARFHYPHYAILFFSTAIIAVGLLIKIRKFLGL